MAGTLTPTPYQTVLDADGVAVSGALIYTYVGGTTTAATTYADASLATPNTNPIVADSGGRFVAYLPAGGNFKFTYKTAAGATIEEQDNILSVPGSAVNLDIEGTVGEAVTAGQVCYLSTGAEATPLTAGLWYLTDADFAPTSTTCQSVGVAVSAIAINTAGTIRLAGTATTATAVVIGSTYYVSATAGAITATPPALSRTVGVALTTSTLLLAATTAVVTPAGSNTQVQFNDSGVLGGDSGFTFIKATDAVAIAGATTVGGTLGVTGATTLSSTASIGGAMLVTGFARLKTGLSTDDTDPGATNLRVGGTSALVGNVTYTTSLKSTTALATPGALTATQATEFASTVSGAAIMGFGTTNDVSLMNRAGTVVLGVGPNTTTVNMTGLLTVSGFGTSSFSAGGTGSNQLGVRNTTSGTGALAAVAVGNNNDANVVNLFAFSSTYTTSGPYAASSGLLDGQASGGLSVAATHASGAIRFYSGGTTERAQFTTTGSFLINTTTALAKFVLSAPMQAIDGFSLVDTSTAFSPNIYIHFYNSSLTVAGSIAHPSASAVTFNTSSDQRLKRDLGLARDVSALRALRIHDFSWTSDGVIDRNVFAQEAYAVMPRGITKGDDDPVTVTKTWMVEKAAYVPDLIVGWQQHDATITQLAARIAALESQDN